MLSTKQADSDWRTKYRTVVELKANIRLAQHCEAISATSGLLAIDRRALTTSIATNENLHVDLCMFLIP